MKCPPLTCDRICTYSTGLLHTMICLFIVMLKRMIKYITRIGQNTGILKIGNRVSTKATTTALVPEYLQISPSSSPITCYVNTYQNLNSGSLLTNGLNSWLALVGSAGPSSVIKTVTRKEAEPTKLYTYLSPPPLAGLGQILE